MDLKKDTVLNICQVNICNLSRPSVIALEKFIWDNKVDVLAIQETKLQKPPPLRKLGTIMWNGQVLKEMDIIKKEAVRYTLKMGLQTTIGFTNWNLPTWISYFFLSK